MIDLRVTPNLPVIVHAEHGTLGNCDQDGTFASPHPPTPPSLPLTSCIISCVY